MIAIGVGCRRGVASADVLALIRATLAVLPNDAAAPSGLYTIAERGDEAGLRQAAAALNLPLVALDRAMLAKVADRVATHSAYTKRLFGLPNVAETAALAGAGPGSVLLVPRIDSILVTCALASDGSIANA